MEKYLIEIFGVYGKGDADKEVESFVVNSRNYGRLWMAL